jgi:uncharacterized protein DUF3800
MDGATPLWEDLLVLLAYVDESGNTGNAAAGGSLTYSLGCVLVEADRWPSAFDQLLTFRRRLRDRFDIPMRAEIKANYLIRNSGDMRSVGLSPGERYVVYRAHMRVLQLLPARAFAVVLPKSRHPNFSPTEVFDTAWEALLQRLSNTSRIEGVTFAVLHDEGENDAIRRWVRRARRYLTAGSAFGTGTLSNPARLLVDDPTARKSHQSYFVQMADLIAYAGFRGVIPPSLAIQSVCPATMWDEIGPATHRPVSQLRPRAKPGIVLR